MTSDRLDIERLVYEYPKRFDAADLDGFADLFAHGTLHLRGLARPATGAAAVRATIDGLVILYDGKPLTNHIIDNLTIDVADDATSATAHSYVQILQAAPDFPLQIIATGFYRDRFERSTDGWRYVERVSTGSLVGDLSHHLRLPR